MRTIEQIDHDIDAILLLIERTETIDPMSCESWQDAWDNRPDLYVEREFLDLERAAAQKVRDAEAEKAWRKEQRRQRYTKPALKKCPTCGALDIAA